MALRADKLWIVSVLHQEEGGIGKSIPDAQDFPRPERFPEGEARGKSRGSREILRDFPGPWVLQNPWPREISRAEGMDFPVPPESWWSTDILSSLPGKALIGFHRYLMKTNENQLLLIKTYEQ